ncbi:MAG: hypothetical protein SWX82_00955 [Cyanobacteriota bacterium]|nr:hypothetical protein [Cyanobacteriota bacterium]
MTKIFSDIVDLRQDLVTSVVVTSLSIIKTNIDQNIFRYCRSSTRFSNECGSNLSIY